MTISSTANRVSYTGNGVTTAFAYPYLFTADSDLVVIETISATGVETTKALTTDYTVTGADNPNGGTVTAVTAPASTVTWTIFRDPPQTQKMDLVENDPLPAEVLEGALDKLTMLLQRVTDKLTRMPQLQETTAVTPLPLVFPEPGASGDVLGWNAGGALTNVTDISGSLSASLSSPVEGELLVYSGTTWENKARNRPFSLKSGSYSATAADLNGVIYVDTAPVTITLPAADAGPAGSTLRIATIFDGEVTVAAAGADSIVIASIGTVGSRTLPSLDDFIHLVSDGANKWYILDQRRTQQITQPFSGLTGGVSVSFANKLGSSVDVSMFLYCTTSEFSYSSGQYVPLGSYQDSKSNAGVSVAISPTTVVIQGGGAEPSVADRTTGAGQGDEIQITAANWSFVVRLTDRIA